MLSYKNFDNVPVTEISRLEFKKTREHKSIINLQK